MVYLKAILGISVLLVGWLAIELAWRRAFGQSDNPRLSGCDGCASCERPCDHRGAENDFPSPLPTARADRADAGAQLP